MGNIEGDIMKRLMFVLSVIFLWSVAVFVGWFISTINRVDCDKVAEKAYMEGILAQPLRLPAIIEGGQSYVIRLWLGEDGVMTSVYPSLKVKEMTK
jgi:hypothetical protein